MSDAAYQAPAPVQSEPAPPPARRHRVRNIVIGILVAIFAMWLVLFITKGRFLKHPFERIVGSATHRQVTVRGDFQLYFDPIVVKFVAEGMTIANPAYASKPNLFQADRIDARVAPWSLFFAKKRFRSLDLTNAAVDLEWNPAHTTNTWTFSQTKGGKPLTFPVIDRAQVAGTTLRYRDERLRLLADLTFDTLRSSDARIGQAVDFAGRGEIRATPFTLTGALLSPDATVARGRNQLRLHANAAHNLIDIAGTLPSIADIEDVPLAVTARGRNAQELLGIIGVAIPRTRAYHLTARLVKDGIDYRFTRLKGVIGDSDVAGTLTVTQSARVHVAAKLATRSLDIVEAAPFIGYNPDIVAAKGVAAAAAATGAAPARLLPDARLGIEAMRVFDADLVWTIGAVKSQRVPISDIALTLALKDGLLKLSPFTFAMARGNVASDIVLDMRRNPVHASYDIRLAPTPMSRLLSGYGVADAGTTGTIKGRIQLEGDGATLHDSLAASHGRIAFTMPHGTMWTRNAQLSELDIGTFVQKMFEHKLEKPVEINCGLIGFTVRNGIAAADPILIDTSKNVIAGRGGFSFGSEAIDLAFRADGKKFSLFSGQSPVGIGGHFAKPSLNVVSGQLLERAGVGLGLAIVATPVAAVLAFVDVGDAKSAACGPVLAGATAAQQRTTKGKPRDDVGHGTTATNEDGTRSGLQKKDQKKKFLGIF